MALILAATQTKAQSIDELKTVKNWKEMVDAFNKVGSRFFNIPKVVSDSEKAEEPEESEKGESQKN